MYKLVHMFFEEGNPSSKPCVCVLKIQKTITMRKSYYPLIILVTLSSFLHSQTIISYDKSSGIAFEKLDTVTDRFAYSLDNVIYIPEKKYVWVYQYIKEGKEYSFQSTGEKNWKLIERNMATDSAAKTIVFYVYNNNSLCPYVHNLGQSPMHFIYYNGMDKRLPIQGFTGLVENEKNIWMHPPRDFIFQVLELNPFPYIKFPISKGIKWKWNLTIGSQWGNPLWKEWEGAIVNRYKYCIIDTDYRLQTVFGELSCAVVKSSARSRIGTTQATFYFHKTFGFVKLEYLNIDGSTIILDLIEVS